MENEQVEQVEKKKNLSTSSKLDEVPGSYAGLAAAIAAELMIGFWFRVRVVPAVKTSESPEYCIRRKC